MNSRVKLLTTKLVAKLLQLQSESLPLTRLLKFIQQDPENRKALLQNLIADKASVERIKNHMSLSVLPDDVSFPLLKQAENGAFSPVRLKRYSRIGIQEDTHWKI